MKCPLFRGVCGVEVSIACLVFLLQEIYAIPSLKDCHRKLVSFLPRANPFATNIDAPLSDYAPKLAIRDVLIRISNLL